MKTTTKFGIQLTALELEALREEAGGGPVSPLIRRKPGRPPKPGTKPWLLELAPDVAALVEAHKAAMGVSRTAALEDLVRKAVLDDLGDAVDHAVGVDGVCACGAADCRAVSP